MFVGRALASTSVAGCCGRALAFAVFFHHFPYLGVRCRHAGELNPEAYIADVLLRLDDTSCSEIDRLLPWNWAKSAEAS